MVRCDECGVELTVGDYPFCPHGKSASVVIADDVPGGFWAVNGFNEPRQFYSHSAHRAALAAENMEIRAKNAGPDDKICARWDTVDLDAAKTLLQRGDEARASRRQNLEPAVIDVREVGTFRESDLDV